MTDKIIPLVEQWQNRALEERYPFIFMDAIHYKVKHDNRIVKKAAYTNSIIQRCVIHQIRSSIKYVPYKHIKPLMKDLKAVYKAPNEEEAYRNLELFKEQWNYHYPTCVKSWYENWDVISRFFKYSENIRKIMYTTNIIENLHRKFRKVTKSKAVFSIDMVLVKILYLVSQDAISKWNRRLKNWDLIRNELSILHYSPLTT